MPAKIIDLDAELDFEDEPVHTARVKLLGREWTVVCDLNSFAMAQIAGGDASGISKFLTGLIHPDEQEDFALTLSSAKNLNGDRLGKVLEKLVEVAGERPTEPPSPSLRTAKKQTSAPRSRAR